jgi:hypothetical protein
MVFEEITKKMISILDVYQYSLDGRSALIRKPQRYANRNITFWFAIQFDYNFNYHVILLNQLKTHSHESTFNTTWTSGELLVSCNTFWKTCLCIIR